MAEARVVRFPWATADDAQVWIVDFRSKSTPLIAQALRGLGYKSRQMSVADFVATYPRARIQPKLVILSGGDQSVYDEDALTLHPHFFAEMCASSSVLGICYGAQLMAKLAGGEVRQAARGEYGAVNITLTNAFGSYLGGSAIMNHRDEIASVPEGWESVARSEQCRHALITRVVSGRRFTAVQFHPEMDHTTGGRELLSGAAKDAGCVPDYQVNEGRFVDECVAWMRDVHPKGNVLCGLSGGVDSSVAYTIARQAYGERLRGIYVGTGWMRAGEMEEVREIFGTDGISYVDASPLFHDRIEAVPYPMEGRATENEGRYYESIRKVMGATFIDAFVGEARCLDIQSGALIQGTNAADIVESNAGLKAHHNVGGLPAKLDLNIIEPLAGLYKVEIRWLAAYLGLPLEIVFRQPFPGPGLALRTWGKLSRSVAQPLAQGNRILEETMRRFYPHPRDRPCQYYVAIAPLPTTGLMGDNRVVGYLWMKRFVWSEDRESYASLSVKDMPAAFTRELDHRLVSEVAMEDGTRFVGCAYMTTGKPPTTTEPH